LQSPQAIGKETTVLGKGVIPQLEKGDVLGHECCGVVDSVGPEAILAIPTSNWKGNNNSFSNFDILCLGPYTVHNPAAVSWYEDNSVNASKLKTDTTVLGKGVIPQLEKGDVSTTPQHSWPSTSPFSN
jgi:hypothetical protein